MGAGTAEDLRKNAMFFVNQHVGDSTQMRIKAAGLFQGGLLAIYYCRVTFGLNKKTLAVDAGINNQDTVHAMNGGSMGKQEIHTLAPRTRRLGGIGQLLSQKKMEDC